MAMGPMGRRGMRPAEKSKRGLRGVQRELFSYSERIKLPMLIALVLAAAGAVLTILGPNQLSKITNLISDSLMGEIDLAAIGRVAGVLLGIYALSALLTYIEHYIMATVTLGLSKQMRRDLCAKINRVPMSYFNRIAHGDILSRVTNDVSTLQQALSNSLPSMISAVAQLTGCVIMMFVTEWRMALAAIAATMIGFVFMFIIMKRSQKYFVDRQESLGTLNGYIEEMYSGHDVVRISRANDRIKEMFRGMNRAVYEANRKSQFLSGIMQPLMNVIGNLGYVAVCVLGAALVMNGSIKFGVITAFILYVRLFTSPLTTIAQGMTQLQSAAAAACLISCRSRSCRTSRRICPCRSRCAVRSSLTTSASATPITRRRRSSMISLPMLRRGRRSPSSVRPAPERRRWSICSCASMIWTAVTSASTVSPQRI